MRFAQRLASGPTKAHGVTKQVVRAYLEGGVDRADEVDAELVGSLFETEDLKRRREVVPRRGPRQGYVRGALAAGRRAGSVSATLTGVDA